MTSTRNSGSEDPEVSTSYNNEDFNLGAGDPQTVDICSSTCIGENRLLCKATDVVDGRSRKKMTDQLIPAQTWCSMPLLVTDIPNVDHSEASDNQPLRKVISMDCIFVNQTEHFPRIIAHSEDIENGKPLCNLLVLSIGWMLFFMSFSSIRNIQSSINHEGGLGLYSMAGLYGGYMVACCFTTVIVKKFSPKWTLVVGMISQIVYTLSILYPRLHVVLPVSVIGGFMQCAMWTAQATLVVDVSFRVPNTGTKCREALISKYFGVFYGFASFSPIIGSIIMSLLITFAWNENVSLENGLVLSTSLNDLNMSISYNETSTVSGYILETPYVQQLPSEIVPTNPHQTRAFIPKSKIKAYNGTDETIPKQGYILNNMTTITNTSGTEFGSSGGCGKKFCQDNMSDKEKAQLDVSAFTRNVLSGTLAVCMLLALGAFAVFLDGQRMLSQTEECVREQLVVMFKLLKTKQFVLISPLIFYHGIQTAFFSGEVTKVRLLVVIA